MRVDSARRGEEEYGEREDLLRRASATAPDALNMLVGPLEVRLVRDCVRAGVCVCVNVRV